MRNSRIHRYQSGESNAEMRRPEAESSSSIPQSFADVNKRGRGENYVRSACETARALRNVPGIAVQQPPVNAPARARQPYALASTNPVVMIWA